MNQTLGSKRPSQANHHRQAREEQDQAVEARHMQNQETFINNMHQNLRLNGPQFGSRSVIYNTYNFNGGNIYTNIGANELAEANPSQNSSNKGHE